MLLALLAASAAADPWYDEDAMVGAILHRDTFIYDPGVGSYLTRDDLLGNLDSYYQAAGFDKNFRLWARPANLDVTTAAPWSGCGDLPQPHPCPFAAVRFGSVAGDVSHGSITTIEWRGAYIALACGNFTQGGAAGPIPTVSGVKYEDLNANGQRDPGEPGLSGWTMRLLYERREVATTTTDANGDYTFQLDADSLPIGAGRYQVVEVQQDGWHASQEAVEFHVDPGVGAHAYTGNDFGNYRNATISGHKFDDHDVDGAWDTLLEPGIASWAIDLSGDGSDTTSTDAAGAYSFSVRPGAYTVQEEGRADWRQTAPGGDGTRSYTVVSGQVVSSADFGNVCLGSAAVDAVDDTTGLPVTGIHVRIEEMTVPGILANDPALPLTADTPATFGDLLPGSYRITASVPDDLYTTDPDLTVVDRHFAIVKQIAVDECGATEVHLHFVSGSTPGKVTGGDLGIALDGDRSTSGFEFMTRGGDPRGTLQFNDHATGLNLHTREIDNLQVDDPNAFVWGHVTVGGVSERFALRLLDAGEPGTSDRYELLLEDGYRAGFDGPLSGGNVQIHAS